MPNNSTEIAKGFKRTNPGSLDVLYGPYDSLAAACSAVPNVAKLVDGVSKNFRTGQVIGLNTPNGIAEYWWKTGVLDADLKVKGVQTEIVSGTNKFNKAAVIPDTYIGSGFPGAGGGLAGKAGSVTSDWMPINSKKQLFVTGRKYGGLRFKDDIGAILQPYNASGVAVNDFMGNINGVLYPPPTAVSVQLCLTYDTEIDLNIVQLVEGNESKPYEPYQGRYAIKKDLLPSEVVTEEELANELILLKKGELSHVDLANLSAQIFGKPVAGSTFLSVRLAYDLTGLLDGLSIYDSYFASMDFLSYDANITGIAFYAFQGAIGFYSGTIPYVTTGAVQKMEYPTGLFVDKTATQAQLYMRVFYADGTKLSGAYLSNIHYKLGNLLLKPTSGIAAYKLVESDSDQASSIIVPQEAPDNTIMRYQQLWASLAFSMLNRLFGLIGNFLGDSITERNGHASYHYYDYLLQWGHMKSVRQYGYSGRCIQKKTASDTDCMSIMYNTMDNNAGLITVFGGTNDYHLSDGGLGVMGDLTTSTFFGALDVLIKGLISKYPLGTIAFFTPLQRTIGSNFTGRNLEDYANAMVQVCRKYAIPCLDLYHNSGFCPALQGVTYTADGLHPNDSGQLLIAKKMFSFLNSL